VRIFALTLAVEHSPNPKLNLGQRPNRRPNRRRGRRGRRERAAPALRAICTGGLGVLIAPSPPSVRAATRNSYLLVVSTPR
jgi:hypothetical protein